MPCADLTGPPESDLSVTPGESNRLSPKANLRLARGPGCTLHILGEIEDLQSAETYPVVKVRPFGPDGTLADPACPAIRWSVGSCPLIRGAMSREAMTKDTIARATVDRPLTSSSTGAFRPDIHFAVGASGR
jgi:hypothetical protein